MPKKPATQPSLVSLPTLSAIVTGLQTTRNQIDAAELQYQRTTLADRLWIGVLCLAGRQHHATGGGRAKKVSRRDTLSEIAPDQVHPQGFETWLSAACPWLPRGTAYKYMDAATGAGLLPDTSESETRQLVADLIAKHDQLSLASLVAQGKSLVHAPASTANGSKPSFEQRTFDALLGYRSQSEQLIACRDHMGPHQYKLACARAYDTLKRLTGSAWAPAEDDIPEYISILSTADAGGL